MMVVLRRLLNMDRIKVISYAEGDSKRHSVELYHVAENRALSQGGVIDSHAMHSCESNVSGEFDDALFKENMQYAAKDAVNRIQETPFAEDRFRSYLAPPETDWVISQDVEDKLRELLKSDSFQNISRHNFVMKPQGEIWDKLCELYGLNQQQSLNAGALYHESINPMCTWPEHYAFTCYRPDDSWLSEPLRRYEIQPILDVSRLPEHHYLTMLRC